MAGDNDTGKVVATEVAKEASTILRLQGEDLLKAQNALLRQDVMTLKAENLNLRKKLIEMETEILSLQSKADIEVRTELFRSAGYDQAAGDLLQRLPTGELIVKKSAPPAE